MQSLYRCRCPRRPGTLVSTVHLGFRLLVISTAMGLVAGQGMAQPDNASANDISAAIEQLGHDDFQIRQLARKRLIEFGPAAIPLLEAAANFESTLDHEVQATSNQILLELNEQQARQRTDEFIDEKIDLAGWVHFKTIGGDDRISRQLYRRVYLEYRNQIQQVVKNPGRIEQTEIRRLLSANTPEQVAWGIFLATLPNDPKGRSVIDQIPAYKLGELANGLGANIEINRHKNKNQPPTMDRLVCSFVKRAVRLAPARQLYVLQALRSSSADQLLAEIVTATDQPAMFRAKAIATLSTDPPNSTIEKIESCFDDTSVVGTYLVQPNPAKNNPTQLANQDRVIAEVQIRDLCLLARLLIAKEKPVDFGFSSKVVVDWAEKRVDIKKAGFVNDSDRQRAFELWQNRNIDPKRNIEPQSSPAQQ